MPAPERTPLRVTSLPVETPEKGRETQLPVAHAHTRGNPFGVTSFPVALSVMGNGTTTIVVVQNVPVAHANEITSGSTTSHHLHKYYLYTTYVHLDYEVAYTIIVLCIISSCEGSRSNVLREK